MKKTYFKILNFIKVGWRHAKELILILILSKINSKMLVSIKKRNNKIIKINEYLERYKSKLFNYKTIKIRMKH